MPVGDINTITSTPTPPVPDFYIPDPSLTPTTADIVQTLIDISNLIIEVNRSVPDEIREVSTSTV